MSYKPGTLPNPQVPQAVVSSTWGELRAIAAALKLLEEGKYEPLNNAPTKPRTGQLAFADGTNWDPGLGAGFYFYDGTQWIAVGRGAKAQIEFPDLSIVSSTTLADTLLQFNVAAGEVWIATFLLDVGAALATTGIKLAITAPAGSIFNFCIGLSPDKVTAGNVHSARTTTLGAAVALPAATLVGIGNGLLTASLGIGVGGTGGTVKLQAAQNTSSGTALLIRQGSTLVAQQSRL